MLRTAATLLGFAVVAFSIGFNTIRYPLVWEMTGPAQTKEAAQPVAVSPPARSEDLARSANARAAGDQSCRSAADPGGRKQSGRRQVVADGYERSARCQTGRRYGRGSHGGRNAKAVSAHHAGKRPGGVTWRS